MKRFATKDDIKKLFILADTSHFKENTIKTLSPYFKRVDDLVKKIPGQQVAIDNYEKRIENLKEKVYTTTS